jgi:hypothetical protein
MVDMRRRSAAPEAVPTPRARRGLLALVLACAALGCNAAAAAAAPCTNPDLSPPPVDVTPTSGHVTDGMVGEAYTLTLTASGGDGDPYYWSELSSLPPGLTRSGGYPGATVTISGTPTTEGHYRISLQATSHGCASGGRWDIEIGPPKITSIVGGACDDKLSIYGWKLLGFRNAPADVYLDGTPVAYAKSQVFSGEDLFEITPLPPGIPLGTPFEVKVVTDGGATGQAVQQYTIHGTVPSAQTGAATVQPDLSSVKLDGTVQPNCLPTTAHFEYGKESAGHAWTYDHSTTEEAVGTGYQEPVSNDLAGLDGGTYHYRLVATNVEGVNQGADMQFTLGSAQIAGRLRDVQPAGLEGIEVQVSGTATRTTTTGPDGKYRFTGLPPGDYAVTPKLDPPQGHLPDGRWVVERCAGDPLASDPMVANAVHPPPCSVALPVEVTGEANFQYRPDPGVLLTAGPDELIGKTAVEFDFAVPGGGGDGEYQCSFDGAEFAPCAAPKVYDGLTDGAHGFGVRFVPQGESPGPATERHFRVDTTPPVAEITKAPSGAGHPRDVTVEFRSNEPEGGTFRCGLDGAQETPCSSPERLLGLADGEHRFTVRAVDAVGNVQPVPATAAWKVGGACLAPRQIVHVAQAPPDAGCVPKVTCTGDDKDKVTVGVSVIAVARTAEACFKSEDNGRRMVSHGPIAINGIRLTPDAGSSIAIVVAGDDGLVLEGGVTWEFTSFIKFHTPVSGKLDLKTLTGESKLSFLSLDATPFSLFGLKFQIAPSFKLTAENGGTTKIGLKLTLPNSISGAPKPVKLPTVEADPNAPYKLPVVDPNAKLPEVKISADPNVPTALPVVDNPRDPGTDYTITVGFDLTLSNSFRPRIAGGAKIAKAWLFGLASLKNVGFNIDSGPPVAVDLTGAFRVDKLGKVFGSPPEIEATIQLSSQGIIGPLRKLGLKVSGVAVPIAPLVFLRRLGADLSGDPPAVEGDARVVKLTGTAGVSLGKKIPAIGINVEPVSIDGTAVITFPVSALDDRLFKEQFYGDGKIAEIPVAAMAASWTSTRWDFSGILDFTFKGYGIRQEFKNAWLDTQEGDFNAETRGTINLGFKSDVETVVSHLGIIMCAVDGTFRYGLGKGWGQKWRVFYSGCDVKEYRAVATPAQYGLPLGFDVPKGARGLGVELQGAVAAPKVVLSGPGGARIDLLGPVRDQRVVSLPDEEEHVTHAVLFAPAAGHWTAVAAPGSALTGIRVAGVRPPVKVSGKVSGRGDRRVLRWRLTPQPGQAVQFVLEGDSTVQVIGQTTKARGTLRFRTDRVPARGRRIVARVTQDGLPRQNVRIATFTAPGPLKVGRVRGIRLRGAALSWRRVAGAVRYYVAATGPAGLRKLADTRKLRLSLPKAMAAGALRATVFAVGADGRSGPVGTRTFKARKR